MVYIFCFPIGYARNETGQVPILFRRPPISWPYQQHDPKTVRCFSSLASDFFLKRQNKLVRPQMQNRKHVSLPRLIYAMYPNRIQILQQNPIIVKIKASKVFWRAFNIYVVNWEQWEKKRVYFWYIFWRIYFSMM